MKRLDELMRLLATGKIGRRDFLIRASALGVGAMMASSMASRALAATPRKGGRFRMAIGHGSTTDRIDPATYENDFMIGSNYTIHNHIGEVDHTGAIHPELAESWEASPDAKTWTIKLRKDVEFHNGKTVDANDVVASINHHRGETESPAKSLLEQVTDIKADGKDTVVITLNAGNADFPYVVSDYHIAIKPLKGGKLQADTGIGTGPFSLKEFEPGVRAAFERNPNYFKPDRGHFDEVELISVHDAAARTNALNTGEVEAIDRVDLKTVHLLQRRPNVKVEEVVGYRHYTFAMRCDTAPFDDNNVRLAVKHAIDRQEVMDKVLLGHGKLGNDHPISPSNQFHNGELEQRTYDPDKAKYYLKQAGLSSLSVKLSAADAAFPGAVDAAVLYKEHAAKAGIEIEVVREPNDGYWSNVWMNKPWTAVYWSGRVTEDWMFTTAYAADANWNDTFWKHERFNELLKAARAELDSAKRREMYYEMQRIVRDEGGVVVPMFANYVYALADKVQHGTLAGNWNLDGMKFAERWWFES